MEAASSIQSNVEIKRPNDIDIKTMMSGYIYEDVKKVNVDWYFSIDNWKRPKSEVNALMKLLVRSVNNEIEDINKNNIRMRIIGSVSKLSKKIESELIKACDLTIKNDGLNLNLAIN